jgi:23S rRNA (pseudouridine1915-N3)-methyltransferase
MHFSACNSDERMKVVLIFAGKTSEKYLHEGIEMYLKRLKNYIQVVTVIYPPSKLTQSGKAILEEQKAIEQKLLPGDFIVILDENGEEISSRQFADLFQKWMVRGISRVVFIVGGAFGIADSLKSKGNLVLSLSRLTYTHQMIRLQLVEQIYRAQTIIKNEKYHHD